MLEFTFRGFAWVKRTEVRLSLASLRRMNQSSSFRGFADRIVKTFQPQKFIQWPRQESDPEQVPIANPG